MFSRITTFAILLALLSLISGELQGSVNKAIALTLKVTGDVKLRKAENSDAGPLKFGTPVDDGDWIKTGDDGNAVLIFADDKSRIRLKENTEVVISGKRDAQSNISKRITMEIGQLFAKVDKQRGSLEIATPSSVASVKGTEFSVFVLEDGTTIILTFSGVIELLNRISGRIVNVSTGEQGVSNPQGGIVVSPAPPGSHRAPDEGGGGSTSIEIEVQDPDGRIRTIILQYRDNEE